jgi:hypothetical protein
MQLRLVLSHKALYPGLIALAIFTSALISPSARAAELPNYPVERWCDQVARSAGSRSEMIYGGCIKQEQTAYDHLKRSWADVPSQTQNWCDQVARSSGGGSYMILNGCVDQESSARQQNSTRRFQR